MLFKLITRGCESFLLSKSALTRLQGIVIILVIIISSLTSIYVYTTFQQKPSPKTAEFQLTDLTINPETAELNQSISISVKIANIGLGSGAYSVDVSINGSLAETKTVQLESGEATILDFTVKETVSGNYFVNVGNLSGTFLVQSGVPVPTGTPVPTSTPKPTSTPVPNATIPDSLTISNLDVSPFETWANTPIQISVSVTNVGNAALNYSLPFKINNVIGTAETLQFSPGESIIVKANVTENAEGTYLVSVGNLTSNFQIVPTGKHTLIIRSFDGIPFTLNGQNQTTPYQTLLDVGTYTIVFPTMLDIPQDYPGFVRHYFFENWADGSTKPIKTINLQSYTLLVAAMYYNYSCPSLYVWNGTSYISNGDVSSDGGWLGFVDHYQQDGSIVFAYSNPWDYVKLSSQTTTRNGYFDIALVEQADEIYYFDSADLIAVDHPANVDVFSTAKTYIYQIDNLGKIYSVSKDPSPPVSAVNGEGQSVLQQISKIDGITSEGRLWEWDTLQLNLGNLSGAKEIKLVITGQSVWPSPVSGGNQIKNYTNQPGETPQPPPFMEVKDANGKWVPVPDNRQFPILTATPTTIVVDLTGLFPTNDYSLRINSFQDIRFDCIGVDTTSQQNMTIRTIKPSYANLSQSFSFPSTSSGNFTRYGDVLSLLFSTDDKMVVGRVGDLIEIRFPADIGPVPEGMVRDYFFAANLWFKATWDPAPPFTVDPLPFQAMTSYPYPAIESFPFDKVHLEYLRNYNTRIVNPP
jgi:hypothetical protein